MSTEPYRWHYDYSRIAWDTGFCFNNQKSQKAFDRNGIALLDIERIIRERDIGIVEHHIQNILEYNLDNEEVRILDPNFVKLFRLSQLAVEYLTYCKKYLDSTVTTIKKDLQQITEENDDLKHDLGYYQSEVHKLKKKVRDLKATLQIIQKYKPIGISSEEIGTFQCNECTKLFVNSEYLKAHILRRHPNNDQRIIIDTENVENKINNSPIHIQYKAETDRLQMEIKSLKEKLNNTERFFQNEDKNNKKLENNITQKVEDKKSEEYYKGFEKLHEQFELLKTQIESELHTLKEQKHDQSKYDKMMEHIITKLDEKSSIADNKDALRIQTTAEIHKEIQVDINVDEQKELPFVENIVEQKYEIEKNVKKVSPSPKKQSNGPKLRDSPTRFIKVSESPTKLSISSIDAADSSTKIQIPPQNVANEISKVKEEVGKELEEKTKQNMEKLSEELTEKMSKTFGKFQEQMESFWIKLQDFETEKEKHKLESKTEIKQVKIESKLFNLPKEESTQQQSKYFMRSFETDVDSDTESSKQDIIPKALQPSSIIPVHQNEKDAKKLIAELKTKVQQRNITKVQEKIIEPKTNNSQKPTNTLQQSKTMESSSETESSSESEESESDSESEIPVVDIKSSKTLSHQTEATRPATTGTGISTLQNRSTRSLENTLHDNPEILEIFKNDLNEVVSNRLKDLGIDPEWTRIPNKTFEQKSDILTHERNMAVKSIKSFLDIRKNIVDKLDEKISGLKPKETPDLSPEPENKTSKFKSIFTQMRNKAKSIIKSEKPVQNLNPTPNKAIYKLTMNKNIHSAKQKESEVDPKNKSPTKKLIKRKQEVLYTAKPIIYETDSDSQISEELEPQAPKAAERSKKLLRKSRSDSSMEILEISDSSFDQNQTTSKNIPVAAARSMDSILEMKKELKAQLSKSIENMNSTVETIDVMDYKDEINVVKNDETIKTIKSNENSKIELENISSDNDSTNDSMEYERIQKSVLKNTTIVGAAKKRVLFDLHSDEKTSEFNETEKDTKNINPNIIKKTIVKSSTSKNEWNDSSSFDSSIFELNKKEFKENLKGKDIISTKAVINVSTKNDIDDDLSDFVISDLN